MSIAERGGRVDRALGDLLVGDLGVAGERRHLAEALGEGADEGGARGRLGDREERAGVLGADVVGQLVALGQANRRLALADTRDLQPEVARERHRLGHSLCDRVEVGHRRPAYTAALRAPGGPRRGSCPAPARAARR